MTAAFQQHQPNRTDPAALSGCTSEEQRAAAASHLAHDARNWLTVLQVYCDLLRNSGAVAANGRNWMEELSNAVERGQGLVTSLLDSAQTSTPLESSPGEKATVEPKRLDLAAIIQARVPLFQTMGGSTIRVESKTVARAETTALRESEFDRILLNLVRNAIEAMPLGGRLKIELDPSGPSARGPLVLRVSDTGNGIPADVLTHIFDSGFSTKPTGCHPNSTRGYGLAIVRELILAAGGSMRVHSRIGHGTCFTIEFPAQWTLARLRPAASQPRDVTAASNRTTPVSGRTRQPNNFGAVRKGTRVPC